jgi:uncharacterized protein
MTTPQENTAASIFDATPYLKLFIDKDGRWFQNDKEIIHPGIYKLFAGSLEKVAEGGYQVRMGQQICRVEVEDAPFVVKTVIDENERPISLVLNDGSEEPLDPRSFWIGADNVPYCRVKGGVFHARFSRPAYYLLVGHIVSGENEDDFFFRIGDEQIPIRKCAD